MSKLPRMSNEADIGHETEATFLLSAAAAEEGLPPPPRRSRSVLYHLLVSVLLFLTAVAMTIPVRPKLILDATGDASLASYFTSLVDCLQSIISIFSSPLFGAISDVIGRKPILTLSQIGELVALLTVARFPRNLYMQFPAYLLIALTNSYFTTTSTIIADISMQGGSEGGEVREGSEEETHVLSTRNFGYLGAATGFCFLVGPFLGGVVEERFYLASSFQLAGLFIAMAMVYVYIFLPETKPDSPLDRENDDEAVQNSSSVRHLWRRTSRTVKELYRAARGTELNPFPRIRRFLGASEALTWLALAISVTSLAHAGMNSIIFLYVNVKLGWDTKETGFFMSMVGLSLLFSQGVLAPLAVRHLGEANTILLGYSLSALHFVVYAVALSTKTMYVGLFIAMLSYTSEPAIKGLLARQVGINNQGGLQGSVSALSSVVRPFSPIIAGAMFGLGNSIGMPGLPFAVIAGIQAVALGLARIAFWKPDLK